MWDIDKLKKEIGDREIEADAIFKRIKSEELALDVISREIETLEAELVKQEAKTDDTD